MNKLVKKLLAMVLCLAMALAIVPVVNVAAASTTPAPEGIVLFEENDWNNIGAGGTATGGYGNFEGQPKRVAVINEDGNKVLRISSDSMTYSWLTLSDLGIASTGSTVICLEYRISAPTVQYQCQIQSNTTGVTITTDNNRNDAANKTFGIGNTDSAEYEVHRQYWTVGAGTLSSVKIRVGTRTGAGDPVKYDYFKLYLVDYSDAQLKAELESADGYAKLSKDFTTEDALTLGDNAVLDLNGHTLTAPAVNGGANAIIIDSSADKTGLLNTQDLVLDNKNNPQLPLKTEAGYIFTSPELGDRAFLVEAGANGFTMDFRPGFGEANGVNIREAYLANGNSGIEMTAQLSWTDIYGNKKSLESGIDATNIFNGMYATATARGRLKVVGAEKFRDISLAISLKSCGVEVTFEPTTFVNSYVTTHFAADFQSGEIVYGSDQTLNVGTFKTFSKTAAIVEDAGEKVFEIDGTNVLTCASPVETGAGKKLVIELKLKTSKGTDQLNIRVEKGSEKIGILTSGGVKFHDVKDLYRYLGEHVFYLSEANRYVSVRLTIDLDSGAWCLYKDGAEFRKGTYAPSDGTTIEDVLNGQNIFYLREDSTDTHYIDDLLIYTVNN